MNNYPLTTELVNLKSTTSTQINMLTSTNSTRKESNKSFSMIIISGQRPILRLPIIFYSTQSARRTLMLFLSFTQTPKMSSDDMLISRCYNYPLISFDKILFSFSFYEHRMLDAFYYGHVMRLVLYARLFVDDLWASYYLILA